MSFSHEARCAVLSHVKRHIGGQKYADRQADRFAREQGDVAAVPFDDFLRDRQSEPKASAVLSACIVGFEEWLESFGTKRHGNSRAVICNFDLDSLEALGPERHCNRAA